MNALFSLLSKKPSIGILSSFGAAAVSTVDPVKVSSYWFTPYVEVAQFTGICIGIAVGAVTLGIKIFDLIEKFRIWKSSRN